ncbi:MAG: protein BatD [Anaerolineales bacterium]|nr:protein BatD [Anaerolineales bacterium]
MKKLFIPLLIVLGFLASATVGLAQGQDVITAQVDRAVLSTDETLTLSVTVNASASNLPNPTLPALDGFNIVGTGSSSQISIINGSMSAQMVYNYRLQPYQAGELVIEPVSMTIDGQTYTTDPISIKVVQGTGQAAPVTPINPTAPTSRGFAGQDAFVEADVDNPTPYLGQQVIYSFRYYEAADRFGFEQPSYEAPAFTGFWSESQTEQNQYQVQAGGRMYRVTELRTILFPSKTGEVTIEPAQLSIPGGFFSRGANLQTDPVTLEIKPLPAGAPASFNGAVGQFTIDSSVDSSSGRANEPITWQVTLSGRGNLNTLPDPQWPDMPGWRSFDSQATHNTQMQDGQVVGSRVYERLLVPQREGDFTIPALEYSYFDPAEERYQTISSQPIPVSIAPGDGTGAQSYTAEPANEAANEASSAETPDLKPAPAQLALSGAPVTASPLYWLAWVVPALGLVGNFFWQRRQQYRLANPEAVRRSQAGKKAKATLKQVSSGDQQPYEAAVLVLTTYLADKFGQPVAGLTRPALRQLLIEKGVETELSKQVVACLNEAETGRFAPQTDDLASAADLIQTVDTVIEDLEKVKVR